ncbi:MAG: hypothetical protein K5905_04290 [Roseibium sp.]|uniref:hypothetical protein n=1 Tax=Roseibium sp. TaxID=1936156 RepID=UPI002618ECDC|nr:hypothetical protein [Roseibium sp.]MCV0424669.1 hypothetical protein [Roseibium sp.]
MNFIVTDTYQFWWPVTVRMPDPEKAGAIIEQKFEALFEAMSDTKAKEMDAAFAGLETDEDRKVHEHDVIREVFKNWRGVIAEDGKDQVFTPDVLERCINHSWFRVGVYEAYAKAMRAEETGEGPTVKN